MKYHIVFLPLNKSHIPWTEDVMQQIQSLTPQLNLFLDSNFESKLFQKIPDGIRTVIIGHRSASLSLRNFNIPPTDMSIDDFIKLVSNQFRHLIREDRINSLLN